MKLKLWIFEFKTRLHKDIKVSTLTMRLWSGNLIQLRIVTDHYRPYSDYIK